MVTELVDKYVFLVQSFVQAGEMGLSWPQIQSRWLSRYGENYPRRSFVNHREAVEELFGIVIRCDRSTNRYLIDRSESAVDRREAVEYLIDTFTVNSLLTLGKERLTGRVSVQEVPSGRKWLTTVMQAMLENRCLRISYRKYMSEESEQREIRPYAVKEFARRWYIVAYSEQSGSYRVYAMDRIVEMESLDRQFSLPPSFSVDALFQDCYGIYLPDSKEQKPVLVKLRTTLREAAYLQDLPLHPSQMLVEREGDKCIFALRLIPNPNLIMDLCRYGNSLEVLEPESLRESVRQALKKAIEIYEN